MTIRHVATIVLVRDVPASVAFYRDVLGQAVREDHGTIVTFEGGLTIHAGAELLATVYGRAEPGAAEPMGRDNLDVYFETEDLEAAFAAVAASGAPIVHPIERQAWGQRVFRARDPDGHIVEIGEPM